MYDIAKLLPEVKITPELDDLIDEVREDQFGEFAEKYGKSNAQIILRWHVQSGNIVIPGSKNPDHIRDNFAIIKEKLLIRLIP